MIKTQKPTSKIFSYTFIVPENILDKEYNHLHHAESIKLLERGRLEFMKEREMPNEYFISKGLFLVLTKLEVNFLREVRSGEVKVTCLNPKIEGKDIVLDQELYNEKGKKAITAKVFLQFLSGETKRGVEATVEFREKFLWSS